MRIVNATPCPQRALLWHDREGRRQCSIIAKATCRLSTGALLPQQEALVLVDAVARDGSVIRPADLVPRRTGTSVILDACVHTPRGQLRQQMQASVRVGPLEKTIVAWGARTWLARGAQYVPSEAGWFDRLPTTMANAFGGPGIVSNPRGTGFVDAKEDPEGRRLPQLEDPRAPIASPSDRPPPASFDAVPPTSLPRATHKGTYDERWLVAKAPLWPDDFDERFFDVAQADLVARPGLRGGEAIKLEGLHPEGTIVTTLPRVPLRIDVGGTRELPSLDLVFIEPTEDRVTLTFRRTYDASRCGTSFPSVSISILETSVRDPA